MPPSPYTQTPDTTAGPAAQAAGDDAAANGGIAVPRGIKRWSKWRQASLRAEHREVRQRLRAHHAETVDGPAVGPPRGS